MLSKHSNSSPEIPVLVLVNNPVYSWKPRPACDGIHIVITIIDINGNICTGASHKNIQFRYTSFQDYVSQPWFIVVISAKWTTMIVEF